MKKLLLNVAVSIDGYIAGPNGEYDWCFADQDYGMTQFVERIDTVLMGRKSFELLAGYGPPYPDKEIYVFSRHRENPPFENVHMVKDDLKTFCLSLKAGEGKDIWLFGGAEITHVLLEHQLVDEMHLAIHPLLLGGGIHLFPSGARSFFSLNNVSHHENGMVQVIYEKSHSYGTGTGD